MKDTRKKLIAARLILSSLVMEDAPKGLLRACKDWCAELAAEDTGSEHIEKVGLNESATVQLVTGGGKTDA